MDFKTFFKGALFSLIAVSLTAGFSYANQSNASKASVATQSELQTPVSEKSSGFNTLAPSQDYLMTGTAWGVFDDYATWPSSSTYKSNGLQQMLRLILQPYGQSSTVNNNFNLFDINGDGLTDVTYAVSSSVFYPDSTHYAYFNYYALLLNIGNNDFEAGYKCVAYYSSDTRSGEGTSTYYGDCAAL